MTAARCENRADHRHFNDDVVEVDFVKVFWGKWAPRAKQQIKFVVGSRRRYQLALQGRGAGKTWQLPLKALYLALVNPGKPGAIMARTKKEVTTGGMLDRFFDHVETFRKATGINLVRRNGYLKQDGIVKLINGSWIYLVGYDDLDSRRGMSLAWLVSDEVDWGKHDAADVFDALQKLVREPCPQPCLAMGTSPSGVTGIAGLWMKRLNGDPVEAARYFVVRATAEDNPAIDPEYMDSIRRGSSRRSWMQEGRGMVLTSSDAVFGEIDFSRHRIPWTWNPDLPYLVGIDWGTSRASAVFCQIQPDGTWVIADEIRFSEGSYEQFRVLLSDKIRAIGYRPPLVGADKAVESENKWLRGHLGPRSFVRGLDRPDDQYIIYGLEAVRSMLDPAPLADGTEQPPRLLISDQLSYEPHEDVPGIVGCLLGYSYYRGRNGVLTNIPIKSPTDPFKHAIDALRYIVVASAKDRNYHGGRILPFAASARKIDFTPPDREEYAA